MNKKNAFFLLVLVIFCNTIFAQTEIGYFIKSEDSSKVKLYMMELTAKQKSDPFYIDRQNSLSVQSDGANLFYYDVNNKKQDIKHKEITKMYLFNAHYILLPITAGKGLPRLHRIVAVNKEGFKLTEFVQGDFHILFILDGNNNILFRQRETGHLSGSYSGQKYSKEIKEINKVIEFYKEDFQITSTPLKAKNF
ncbi:MAG TPA: hypothetical protein PLS10_12990 [Chitinophagales bacterium]|nr:hypothetical protein [Chitinophagales bacterium]